MAERRYVGHGCKRPVAEVGCDQLVAMQLSERQRPQLARAVALPSIDAMIEAIRRQLDDVEARMARHVEQHHAALARVLQAVAGIGRVAAATLVAELPELGRLNRRQVCALVGVAPYANDPGSSRGRQRIAGGPFQVRRALCMAMLAAIRCNGPIRAFYKRLVVAGKLKKVALIASMRKLITHLNAIARNHLNTHHRPAIA